LAAVFFATSVLSTSTTLMQVNKSPSSRRASADLTSNAAGIVHHEQQRKSQTLWRILRNLVHSGDASKNSSPKTTRSPDSSANRG
jgi:predicted component of type VI protein secretion system